VTSGCGDVEALGEVAGKIQLHPEGLVAYRAGAVDDEQQIDCAI